MGRTGSCFHNSAAEAFFSTLEWEVLRRHHFTTKDQARQVICNWANDFYNLRRRHSTIGMTPPVVREQSLTLKAKAAYNGTLNGPWGSSPDRREHGAGPGVDTTASSVFRPFMPV